MSRKKSVFKSKLNNLGVILGIVGVAMTTSPEVRDFFVQMISLLPEGARPLALSFLGALIFVLRTFFTSQPVALKKEPESIQ